MIYFFLALLTSLGIVVLFKLCDKYNITLLEAILINYIIAVACCFLFLGKDFSITYYLHANWIPFSLINGILLMLVFWVFASSTQVAGVAVTAVSSKMSVVIQVLLGIFLYHDNINVLKIIGICTCLIALILIFYSKNTGKIEINKLLLPLILFLGVGSNDAVFKYAEYHYIRGFSLQYLLICFVIAFFVGIFFYIYKFKRNKKQFLLQKNLIAGVILGLLNFFSTWFFIKAIGEIESVVFFPIFNVSIISFAAIIGVLWFKEKLKPINWFGVAAALIAILLIAFS